MKYVVFLGDGMADTPVEALQGKTPLAVAKKPHIDALAPLGEVGLAKTVPDGMKPGSDTANLAVMGYDPRTCYSGRSPLEALSMGLTLADTDIAVRCNLVTLSDEDEYADKRMIDYSAGEITSEESRELIEYIEEHLGDERVSFHPGISYRHCLIVHDAAPEEELTPPHDITGKPIKEHLPKGTLGELFLELQTKSYDLLKDHPINLKRIAEGKNPANSIWLWGEGTKPQIPDFTQKNGVKGAVISAVDLLKGIGKGAGMEVIEVEGATGNVHTDFRAKGRAAIDALGRVDYVYIHVEAPDESGHQGSLEDKITSIEKIDSDIVGPVLAFLKESGEPYHVLVCPDHPTPLATRTHSAAPIPYLIYKSDEEKESGVDKYDEEHAESTGIFVEEGFTLIDRLLAPSEKSDDPDEKKEEAKKEKKPSKFGAFFKRHLALFVIGIALILVAAGLAAGHLIATYHLSFIRDEADLNKALSKAQITTLVFKKDVTVGSDLILDKTVNFDLNEHTLTVKGDFTLPLEQDAYLGYKSKGDYRFGGKIVANKLTASGTKGLYLFADLDLTSASLSAAEIYYIGTITGAENVTLNSEIIDFRGDADSTLSLSSNADFTLSGAVTEVMGGKKVSLREGSIKSVIGVEGNTPTVYDYAHAVEKTVNVANYYRVTRLAVPEEVYVLEENGDFRCYVSEVIGATVISYTLNGVEQAAVPVTAGTTVITLNSDNLTPGEQVLVITMTAPNDPRYLDSDSKSVSFEFSAQLDTPIPTVAEEEGKIILTLPAVKHADKYVYTIRGESYETKEVKTDITDKVAEGGSYVIKVTAKSDNKYFSDSHEAMTGYVTYLTLAAPLPHAEVTEETVTFSWEAIENAANYRVTYAGDEIHTTATSLTLPYAPEGTFTVQAIAKGGDYRIDSAVTTLTAAEIVTPQAEAE